MNEFDAHGHVLVDGFDPDFTQEVLCHSDTAARCGLCNACPEALLPNLKRLSQLLGGIQALMGGYSLNINSAYRCTDLNRKVGGVEDSQHTLGLAADWVCPQAGTPLELARRVVDSGLEFDQLILEFNRWVHVSVAPEGRAARREVLSIFSGQEGYLDGLWER